MWKRKNRLFGIKQPARLVRFILPLFQLLLWFPEFRILRWFPLPFGLHQSNPLCGSRMCRFLVHIHIHRLNKTDNPGSNNIRWWFHHQRCRLYPNYRFHTAVDFSNPAASSLAFLPFPQNLWQAKDLFWQNLHGKNWNAE